MLMVLLVVGAGCGSEATQPAAKKGPRKEVPEEGTNIQAYLSEAGMDMGRLESRVKGKLRSPYMLHFQRTDSPYFEFPHTVHVDFYKDSIFPDEKPVIESKLDARYGKYLPNQDKVFLRDSVVVKNILKGDTLYCKYLWWDQHTQRFSTEDSVEIHQRDKILHGTGMEADQNFRWFTIKHMIGVIYTSGNNFPK
ncbi:MAG TPA: LPS export ABC transporter periplasmic protein LptC [Puia sp.]|nr:LPS export ABC transporter periplasmic protein LptC [Puia sp.]